jgi:hypothetical protein
VVLVADAQHVANRGSGQLRWQGRSLHRELSDFAGGVLPSYMLPARYVSVPALPLTPHGKVDRAALREFGEAGDGATTVTVEDPLTPTEQEVSQIWGRNLGLARVDRTDHFLEIGGHSLVAVQVIAEVREHFAADVPIGTLFDSPVLADFAAALDRLVAEG